MQLLRDSGAMAAVFDVIADPFGFGRRQLAIDKSHNFFRAQRMQSIHIRSSDSASFVPSDAGEVDSSKSRKAIRARNKRERTVLTGN